MSKLSIFILVIFCSGASGKPKNNFKPAEVRIFENNKGQLISAEYISSTKTHVTIKVGHSLDKWGRKFGGKSHTLPIASLSQKTQDYIAHKALMASDRYKREVAEWSLEKHQTELNRKAREWSRDLLPTDDANKPINRELYPRRKAEIARSITAIERAAQSQSQFSKGQQEAVAALNTYRYLCGLPYRVNLDKRLCEGAEKAAEGCAKIGRLSHDVNAEAAKCNLGRVSLGSAVHNYINDPGESNREDRGHRQWCLSPKMGKVGFGMNDGWINKGRQGWFNAMWVYDNSGPSPRYKDKFFAYPSRGFFPTEYIKRGTAWSVYFPKGKLPSKGQIELKVFEIEKELKGVPSEKFDPPGSNEVKINYLAISNIITPCNNFEPQTNVAPGKRYWVRVKVGRTKIGYLVEFY